MSTLLAFTSGYVSGLTFRNTLILGDIENPLPLSSRELADRETETTEFHSAFGKGIAANRNSQNLNFENLDIAGFTVGIQALTQSRTKIETALLQNVENLLVVTPQATSLSDNMRRIDARDIKTIPLSESALDGQTPYDVRLLKQIDRAPVAGGSTATTEWQAFTAQDEIYYNNYRLYFDDQAADAVPFPNDEAPGFLSELEHQQYVDLTNAELSDQFDFPLGGEVAPADSFDGLDKLRIGGLVVELDDLPELPSRIVFDYEPTEPLPTWQLGDTDLELSYRTSGLNAETEWRILLNGPDGNQEISRAGIATEYASVTAGEVVDGWQTWNFRWPEVGVLPPEWNATVEPGTYSLLAIVDNSGDNNPAVYLGPITFAAPPNVDPLPPTPTDAIDDALVVDLEPKSGETHKTSAGTEDHNALQTATEQIGLDAPDEPLTDEASFDALAVALADLTVRRPMPDEFRGWPELTSLDDGASA